MDIILIRHGQTQANQDKIFGGPDTPLTQKGEDQARASSHTRVGKGKKVLISPYKRAQDTARLLGLEGELEADLREISLGAMEGYSYMDYEKIDPIDARAWAQDPINHRISGGESVLDLYNRVDRLMERLVEADQDVILVCHEGVIRAMLSLVFGSPDFFFRFKIDNLGFSKLVVDQGYAYIGYSNRIHY